MYWKDSTDSRAESANYCHSLTHPSRHDHWNGLDQALHGDELVETEDLTGSDIQPVLWHHTCGGRKGQSDRGCRGTTCCCRHRWLTQTFLRSWGSELHQVLQVRLLRGNLKVADVTVSLLHNNGVNSWMSKSSNHVLFLLIHVLK